MVLVWCLTRIYFYSPFPRFYFIWALVHFYWILLVLRHVTVTNLLAVFEMSLFFCPRFFPQSRLSLPLRLSVTSWLVTFCLLFNNSAHPTSKTTTVTSTIPALKFDFSGRIDVTTSSTTAHFLALQPAFQKLLFMPSIGPAVAITGTLHLIQQPDFPEAFVRELVSFATQGMVPIGLQR